MTNGIGDTPNLERLKKKVRKCDLNRNALYQVRPEDGAELRQACKSGDNFKHQELVDWWRSISSSDAR